MEANASEVPGGNRLLLKFNGYIHNGGSGAVDVRGERTEPTISAATRNKVEKDRAEERETLERPELEELATPKMTVTQREFPPSSEETNVERKPFTTHPLTRAELFYSASDGHDHWHLQHVARYALETKAGAGVSPGQKVGFCLDDSLHRDTSKGPSTAAYADNVYPFRQFCQKFKPETTSLYEGISPGWTDLYGSYLAWQWVDLSNVAPGEYIIAEEVDPEHILEQEAGGKKTATSLPVIVPGYDAQPVSAATEAGQAKIVSLASKKWIAPKGQRENPQTHKLTLGEPGPVEYRVAHQPEHGHVTVAGGSATYTPEAGFSGTDHFTFVARDQNDEFPRTPVEATATVSVGSAAPQPEVTITNAPSGMTTGTTATLTAKAANDTSSIEWSTSGGSIKAEGTGETATLTAPSGAGEITVTATLADHKASAKHEIPVTAPASAEPAPSVPGTTGGSGGSGGVAGTSASRGLSRPRAMLFGRRLVISTTPYGGGRIKVRALLGKHLLGSCQAVTPANRQFTCRIKLRPKLSLRARIAIVATLKEGPGPHQLFTGRLAAHTIPQMKMVPLGSRAARAASAASGFWCSPSTLVPTLSYRAGSVTRPAAPARPRRRAR